MMDLDQFQNWIQAIRARDYKLLTADIAEGALSSALPHLANIACGLKRSVTFDPKTEQFPGDEEANRLLTRDYRKPYLLPEEV
jgi:hypothetical protein